MFLKFFLSLLMLAALPGGSISNPNGHDDLDDSTSFRSAYEFNHEDVNGMHYAEVFGVNDTYDYIKYYANYSRSVLLTIEAEDNCVAYVDVYVNTVSANTPVVSYRSDVLHYGPEHTVFVPQGSYVNFKVRCSGNCWWTATLHTNPHASPCTYVGYEKFYGYELPYYGTPEIYYAYDDSCDVLVPGQNYTYADVMDEAIEIWESCGNVDFVYAPGSAYFTCEIDSSIVDIEVIHSRYLTTNNWFTSSLKLTDNMQIYNSVIFGQVTFQGTQPTLRQAILGHAVIAFGLALGIGLNSTNSNSNSMMSMPFWWYDHLGDGDIGSLIALWGDANETYC